MGHRGVGSAGFGYRRLCSLPKKKPASVRKLVKYRKSNQVRRSFWGHFDQNMGDPGGSGDEESACDAGDPGLIPGSGKIPWRREWLPTPAFLPEEFHGLRSLVGYNPWGYFHFHQNIQNFSGSYIHLLSQF